MNQIVQIRALGASSPLGPSWPQTWEGLLKGQSRLAPFAELELGLPVSTPVADCAGLNRHLEGSDLLEGASFRLARQACREALASVKVGQIRLYGGTTHGESDILVSALRDETTSCDAHFRSLLLDTVPALLAREFEFLSVDWTYSSCVSGSHALLAAWLDLKSGAIQQSLVVGSDALSAIGVAGFNRVGATSKKTCRPFQSDRDGTIVGEGAAAVLLDTNTASHTNEVSLLSFGVSCDAGHPTKPDPSGRGLEAAVQGALRLAGLRPSEVGTVYLHGTGTLANDAAEAITYQRVFGNAKPPATSLKGCLGHSMGATGLMSCLAAVETIRTGLVPPTVLKSAGDFMSVNLVVESARQIQKGNPVLVHVSAFGGNNVAFVLGPNR